MKLIVSKFGGSSMADAAAMRRSAEISLKQNSSLVVVSATYSTTNQLIDLISQATTSRWEECLLILDNIKEKHRAIASELSCSQASIEEQEIILRELEAFARGVYLLKECSLRAKDSIQAVGERLSSNLFSEALRQVSGDKLVHLLDVRKVLRTNDDYGKATPIVEVTAMLARKNASWVNEENTITVTQGFIGSTEEGVTTTLGRGGSDYSAALLAEAFQANILEIWTDVAGISTTDPRVCSKAIPINEISFKEAAEMAVFGAKILHPTTLTPALRSNIGVFVGSSYEPDQPGTWIRYSPEKTPLVRAIALRKNQSLVTLSTPKMLNTHGFLYEIFKKFSEHKVSVDAITTSEISVALTVDDSTLNNKQLFEELRELCQVRIEETLALVSLIGNNINHTPGLAKKIFNVLENINVRMICQGASLHNFCFLVDGENAEDAVKLLHHEFIENK